jgi:hypothetical protein
MVPAARSEMVPGPRVSGPAQLTPLVIEENVQMIMIGGTSRGREDARAEFGFIECKAQIARART